MKTIYLRGGKEQSTSIQVMTHHLEERGHTVVRSSMDPFEVGLSWGMSYNGEKPFLNQHVNTYNKYDCFNAFRDANILCPTTFSMELSPGEWPNRNLAPLPWLARNMHHSKGKDIVVCRTSQDVLKTYYRQTRQFFSVYIPTDTEYRVWVFRKKAFAIYEKVYNRPGEFKGYIRNRRFGFDFSKRDELLGTPPIEGPSIAAVKALGMDWGAVDILLGKDGRYYVLEVNSMPQIADVGRSCGVRLAKRVSKWAESQDA